MALLVSGTARGHRGARITLLGLAVIVVIAALLVREPGTSAVPPDGIPGGMVANGEAPIAPPAGDSVATPSTAAAARAAPVIKAQPASVAVGATTLTGANVRVAPSATAAVAGTPAAGITLSASERSGNWVLVRVPGPGGISGWVNVRLLSLPEASR